MVYKLELKSSNFESDTICMGWQLVGILKNFIDLEDTKWLAFDVYGTTHNDLLQLFKADETGGTTFDHTTSLISSVEKMIQFEQGVFCLISNSEIIQFEDGIPETESPEGLQIQNSFLEVRAFDYTLFEIYSSDKEYLEKIKNSVSNQDGLSFKTV